jgi:peroxiredoxin
MVELLLGCKSTDYLESNQNNPLVQVFWQLNLFLTAKKLNNMALKIGDNAPSFALFSTEKQQVTLEEYRGKNVVLLFFPMAFTGVCTQEMCSMRDSIADYQGLNAEVLAVSVDSLFTLAKFKEEQNLNFPLLSDFNKEASTAYDAIYEEFVFGMKGVSRRAAFVIDGNGILRYAEVLESAGNLPNFEAVKATLATLN